jgi:hypothetical protein
MRTINDLFNFNIYKLALIRGVCYQYFEDLDTLTWLGKRIIKDRIRLWKSMIYLGVREIL